MSSIYTKLVKSDYFDAFTWVPTVQGNLCIKLLDRDNLDGNIDKYLINFETQVDRSKKEVSKFIAATMLTAEFDQKPWPTDFSGVFRCIIRGTINYSPEYLSFQEELTEAFESSEISTPDLNILKNSCIGTITFLHNEHPELPSYESKFLRKIATLSEESDTLNKAYNVEALNFGRLADIRNNLFKSYKELEGSIKSIEEQENEDLYLDEFPERRREDNPYRIWKFRFIMSEDGLLLLKNVTESYFNDDIPSNDLAQKTLPRIYKMASVRIKHLFHKHYHHMEKNDTYITVSNLNFSNDPEEIALNQVHGITKEIVKAKRNNNYAFTNFAGISAYADSFITILCKHSFFDTEQEKIQKTLLSNLKNDSVILESENSKIYSFLSRNFVSGLITWYLPLMAFLIAVVGFCFQNGVPKHAIIITLSVGSIVILIIHMLAVLSMYMKVYIPHYWLTIKLKKRSGNFNTIGLKHQQETTDPLLYNERFVEYLRRRNRRLRRLKPRGRIILFIAIFSILLVIAIIILVIAFQILFMGSFSLEPELIPGI